MSRNEIKEILMKKIKVEKICNDILLYADIKHPITVLFKKSHYYLIHKPVNIPLTSMLNPIHDNDIFYLLISYRTHDDSYERLSLVIGNNYL